MQQQWADLVGTPVAVSTLTWSPQSVALYHLGVGVEPGDEYGLDYLLDDRLRVLPTFAALACFPALIHLDELPGLEHVDLARVLHGTHAIELDGPIPASGSVTTEGEIVGVSARRANLHVTVEQRSVATDGSFRWTNRYTMVCRGAAGDEVTPRGPAGARPAEVDVLAAEAEVDAPLAANLAHLYRQSGDDNPLHLDPAYARRGGFDAPILQGLCTLGAATRAVVDTALGGRPETVRAVEVRFSDVVLPGATLTTALRTTAEGIAFEARVGDRRVLERGLIRTG